MKMPPAKEKSFPFIVKCLLVADLALPKASSSTHSRDLRGQGVRGRAPSLPKSSLYVSVELVPALRLGQLQQTWCLPLARALGL